MDQPITDPAHIRALAHPTRLDLLDHLSSVGEATATECAEATGESVASCSFHLRTLAKYGYIERSTPRGREKPWRLIHAFRDMRPSPDVPGSHEALAELGGMIVLWEAERVRRYLASIDTEDDAWVQASTISSSDVWLTVEELAALSKVVQQATAVYRDRTTDPSLRPEGARRVRYHATLNPYPGPADGD